MPDLHYLRGEIEHMRRQIHRQRREIKDLQRAGIPAKSAEELLEWMLAKVDGLCAERDRQRKEQLVKSRHRQGDQRADRAARPVSTYRRILRGAEQTCAYWVALEEKKCTGQNFHLLRDVCDQRGLSLSRHGHSVMSENIFYQVFMFAVEEHAEIFRGVRRSAHAPP